MHPVKVLKKKRDEGARWRRRRCTSHVLLGPNRIDCPEVCSNLRLVQSYASYSPRANFRESDLRERAIVANRDICANQFCPCKPTVPPSRYNSLFRGSVGDESEFIAYIVDVCGIIYEDELIITKLVSKCSMVFKEMYSEGRHWCFVERGLIWIFCEFEYIIVACYCCGIVLRGSYQYIMIFRKSSLLVYYFFFPSTGSFCISLHEISWEIVSRWGRIYTCERRKTLNF